MGMADDAAAEYAALKIQYDAVRDGISNGRATVRYVIRGREHEVVPTQELLDVLLRHMEKWDAIRSRSSSSPLRLAQIRRARPTN